ncbi:MAG: serine hydrolase [Bacteroidetes bacterium]|nr:serine hydrolase [Bacteroidota bacterium]MBS1650046.1 serine hydrolase [Bacteroidota bacterium]
MQYINFFILLLCCYSSFAQPKTSKELIDILNKSKSSLIQNVMNNKDSFKVQIIYTQINRDKNNIPHFTNYYFNVDANKYFNPASTVKLPLAFLSLEKFNNLKINNINAYTSMLFDSAYSNQVIRHSDSTSENGFPSIAQFIRKAFLVSDNDAYNRMYQWMGQQTINRNLHTKGYTTTRITREFMGFTEDENRHTNPIRFIDAKGNILYKQPMQHNTDSFHFPPPIKVGRGYLNAKDSLINEPIDFTKVNNLPLEDLQQILQSVLFPESVPAKQRFRLTTDDYKFLYKYLSQYPSETNYPFYDTSHFYDSYVKFFFREKHQMPQHVRVFNKVGWAYGFLTDASYIVDFENKVEFMLAATIYTNSDGILNDDKYDYETIGWPFMYQIGQTIYQYELQRSRKYQPNLNKFKINYDHRNSNDKRKQIKEVDN